MEGSLVSQHVIYCSGALHSLSDTAARGVVSFSEENTLWKEPSAAKSSSEHPESETAKEIMNKILVFPFMWNSAEFQDLNSKSYNLQENIQLSLRDFHSRKRPILDG